MKHWRLIAVCALVAVSAAASHATAQYKAEFKNSLVVGPTGPWGEAAVKFADLLKERTQGRIYDKWVGKVGADLVKSTESIVEGTK